MNKTNIRIILVLVIALGLSLSAFAVLYTEQKKMREKAEASGQDVAARREEIVRARKEYYDGVARQREELRKQMADSKAQYDELLRTQKETVAGKMQTITQTTEQTVPVTVTKPKSVSKTKSS